ncbi:MAG: TATA-box-binding protein [Candidatus Bathyarchaeota archaeon]|nr:TATA-box-binding protein [Candidatus Bathyarchaeota archaeon]
MKIRANKYNVVIQNVVATASLGTKIDLIAIMKFFGNIEYRYKKFPGRIFRTAEYRPNKFPGLVFRLKRPKTATLIFSTGKMVCTGAKSAKLARRAVRKVVKELKKAGFIIPGNTDIVIQNMVASAHLGGGADLEAAADILDVMYEPEQFPGAVYRMDEPKVVILIFSSGSLVITGAKSEEQVHEAAEKIHGILLEDGLIY